jgi:hypothetical protein
MKAALFASLAAIAVQPLFFTTWILLPPAISGDVDLNDLRQVMELLIFVVAFAAGFVLLLGLPLFFVLHRSGRDSWASLAGTGFVVAGLPVSILSWPIRTGSSSGGGWHGSYVQFVVDGVPTVYGWLQYVEGIVIYGLHGLIGAIVFFHVWRHYSGPNHAFKGDVAKATRP